MSNTAISIRNLYKIFGSDPKEAMKRVEKGMKKNELLELTGHVLGINNICLEIK